MTQEDIIRMAREVGCTITEAHAWERTLTNFAELVAAHTLANIDPSKFMSYHERKEVGDVDPV